MIIKKALLYALGFVFLLHTPSELPASAPHIPNPSIQLDSNLKSLGVPQEIISLMATDQKAAIIQNNGKVATAAISTFDQDGHLLQTTVFHPDGTTKQRTQQDGSSRKNARAPSMRVAVVSYHTAGNPTEEKERRLVELSYVWDQVPSKRGFDPIAFSWGSGFMPVANTLIHKDYYRNGAGIDKVYHSDSAASDISPSGIAWVAKLYQQETSQLKGYGSVAIERTDRKTAAPEDLYGSYVHTWGDGNINISLDTRAAFTGSKPHSIRTVDNVTY